MATTWKHRIVEKDIKTLTGVCAACGSVKLRRKKRQDGKYRYLCSISQGRWNGRWVQGKQYGLTEEDLRAMREFQSDQCAICRLPLSGYHVDHDHQTGVVRLLLCAKCNMGLGQFADDPAKLRAAAEYIEAFRA